VALDQKHITRQGRYIIMLAGTPEKDRVSQSSGVIHQPLRENT